MFLNKLRKVLEVCNEACEASVLYKIVEKEEIRLKLMQEQGGVSNAHNISLIKGWIHTYNEKIADYQSTINIINS